MSENVSTSSSLERAAGEAESLLLSPSLGSVSPPPPYVQSKAQLELARTEKATRSPTIRPSNFRRVTRDNLPITGMFVIDPDLEVPDDLLEGPPSQKRLRNLYLKTNREVDVDVWTKRHEPVPSNAGTGKVVVEMKAPGIVSKHTIRLHVGHGTSCALNVYAKAHLYLAIPADLVGPINLDVGSDRIYFSDSVQSRLITFSETHGGRRCFLGDLRNDGYTHKDSWKGSSIAVTLESSAAILYIYTLGEKPPQASYPACTVA
ncbi:hypothetical protein EIP91_001144 [Steccherinum ochraceum]|uniref:DUF7330 domain-containing protein n=1 Tax=Steccherinum ochraceum TaxID=92696 RepID=A0A4V2MWK3_9APHY|nr:hypothetical protein EIP91_001144 [Steccherinum ochraceum]